MPRGLCLTWEAEGHRLSPLGALNKRLESSESSPLRPLSAISMFYQAVRKEQPWTTLSLLATEIDVPSL